MLKHKQWCRHRRALVASAPTKILIIMEYVDDVFIYTKSNVLMDFIDTSLIPRL